MSEDLLPPAPADDNPYTPDELRRELLLERQQRGRVSVRVSFCQQHGGDRAAGPLHLFVQDKRPIALQLYLLQACLASGDPWDARMSGSTWALALGRQNPGAEATISRNWAWLEKNHLVRLERRGRALKVFRLDEFGVKEYKQPDGRVDRFFYLPFAYFTEEWHAKLSLRATAALLIALSLSTREPWFDLPTEHAPERYKISADTLQRGLVELQDEGLLKINRRKKRDRRARFSTTTVNDYALLGSFMTPKLRPEKRP